MSPHRPGILWSRPRFCSLAVAVGALTALAIGAGLAVGATAHRESTSIKIKIAHITSYTGAFSASGPAFAKAANLAVQQAAKALRADGIHNVGLSIETIDDGSTTDGAVQAAQKAQSDGANCIVGPLTSGSLIGVAQAVAIPAQIPVISPSASSPAITTLPNHQGIVFRLAPSDSYQAIVLAKYIKQTLPAGASITLAGENDVFGTGILEPLNGLLKGYGFTTNGPIYFDTSSTSYDSEASQITSGNPTAYVFIDTPGNYGQLGAALLRTGSFSASKVFLAGSWPTTIPSFVPPDALNGAAGTRPGAIDNTTVWQSFNTLFGQTPGVTDRQAADWNAFDATMLCILAGISSNSSSPSAIAKQIPAVANYAPGHPAFSYLQLAKAIRDLRSGKPIHYIGIGGADDLDANGDRRVASYFEYKFVNGAQVIQKYIVLEH